MLRPAMTPVPGDHAVRYVGDRLRVDLAHPAPDQPGWRAFLRTNLTRGTRALEETIALAGARPGEAATFAGASWRDIPLQLENGGWSLDLALTEPGHFRAKAYALDPAGRQHWPSGDDLGLSVLPDRYRTANLIYCAFPRMFGASRDLRSTRNPEREAAWADLDRHGLTLIPPSGTLRDLTRCLPHIFDTLGCRILHLLPVGPTPTTFARMGRYGSPYAQLDLTAIDLALVEFDRRTTAVDQFRELADGVHLRGGSLFLDIVVNHTGWGSRLMETRPEWFRRNPDGTFQSPGAWGITWGDLVELDGGAPAFWEEVAEALLTWCRRGVDGFRCDAGYMVPLPVWQYLTARVHQEFPDCAFLLEGLGGAWEATERLLGEGGMQWAYSELFQNHEPRAVAGYLDHSLRQAGRLGPLVHYGETHDNDRLARRGAAWSLLRNRLCALASTSGAYGFTAGVEWLAEEKLDVHEARGLSWGAEPNLVPELAALNRLLAEHPCFFDGARVARLSPEDSPVLALARHSREGLDACLVLVNLDPDQSHGLALPEAEWKGLGLDTALVDLLGGPLPAWRLERGRVRLSLAPGAAHGLAAHRTPAGLAGEAYRAARARAAWGLQRLAEVLPAEAIGPCDWRALATRVDRDPAAFLAAVARLKARDGASLLQALDRIMASALYPPVVRWTAADARRVTPLPEGHWLLLEDEAPFEATLAVPGAPDRHLRSIPAGNRQVAALPPGPGRGALDLRLIRFGPSGGTLSARLLRCTPPQGVGEAGRAGLALLTNGRGGMARLQADLGAIASKYDCLLGANLHPAMPCDRHVLAKRLRAWVIADGFLTALDAANLVAFEAGPPARWRFRVHAGDGRTVGLDLVAALPPGRNAVQLLWSRGPQGDGPEPAVDVRLTVRLDLEDRSYHEETRRSEALEHRFRAGTALLEDRPGFRFQPAPDRGLRAWSSGGAYHPEPEWSACRHPVEASRGMADAGDAWSPGWFELPLAAGATCTLGLEAIPEDPPWERPVPEPPPWPEDDPFGARLARASEAFLARRGGGLTVIAGYPWFLDWGRDTLIAARGFLAAGRGGAVLELLRTFGALARNGTLPNRLAAGDTGDRHTSDAPLWFALALEEAAEALGPEVYAADAGGRSLGAVLRGLAEGALAGCPNGVQVDAASGLLWSPSHFTWMDTNHPAGTPREGYPVELQALWIRLLRQLARLGAEPSAEAWDALALRAEAALERFWLPGAGWYADVLAAPAGVPAAQGRPLDHLRPNQLFLVSLGLVQGPRARSVVAAAQRHLLVPGALRSLAPLPVREPLEVRGADGRLLNDPSHPYWGRYEGDEDTRRKPAYHNGTAWVWLLPTFCEALAGAWDHAPEAVAAARALLGPLEDLLAEGCVGQLPELLDGDVPHAQRGCDAQAWSATEALRVWRRLGGRP